MLTQTKKRKVQLSVTVSPELKVLVQELADANNTTKSGIISKCLEEFAKRRKEELMIRYYESMAQEDEEFANKSIKVIQGIAASWSD